MTPWADAARAITWPEEYADHGAELRAHPDRFSPVTRSRLQEGLQFTGPDYVLALRARSAAWTSTDGHFQTVDLLVLPTTKAPAPAFGYEHLPGARDLVLHPPVQPDGHPGIDALQRLFCCRTAACGAIHRSAV